MHSVTAFKDIVFKDINENLTSLSNVYELEIKQLKQHIEQVNTKFNNYQKDHKRLTGQLESLQEKLSNANRIIEETKLEEKNIDSDDIAKENHMLYDLLLFNTNEEKIENQMEYVRKGYPDEVMTFGFKLLKKLVELDRFTVIPSFLAKRILALKGQRDFKD